MEIDNRERLMMLKLVKKELRYGHRGVQAKITLWDLERKLTKETGLNAST